MTNILGFYKKTEKGLNTLTRLGGQLDRVEADRDATLSVDRARVVMPTLTTDSKGRNHRPTLVMDLNLVSFEAGVEGMDRIELDQHEDLKTVYHYELDDDNLTRLTYLGLYSEPQFDGKLTAILKGSELNSNLSLTTLSTNLEVGGETVPFMVLDQWQTVLEDKVDNRLGADRLKNQHLLSVILEETLEAQDRGVEVQADRTAGKALLTGMESIPEPDVVVDGAFHVPTYDTQELQAEALTLPRNEFADEVQSLADKALEEEVVEVPVDRDDPVSYVDNGEGLVATLNEHYEEVAKRNEETVRTASPAREVESATGVTYQQRLAEMEAEAKAAEDSKSGPEDDFFM